MLDRAPATLDATPSVAAELSNIIPPSQVFLADLNPMLAFLAPYGRDLAAFVANVGQVFSHADGTGRYLRALVVLSDQGQKDQNVATDSGRSNAYPEPGQSAKPGPFDGQYPRVEEEPTGK